MHRRGTYDRQRLMEKSIHRKPERQRSAVSDLEALERLCDVADRCIQVGDDFGRNLESILDAAIFLTTACKGNIQLSDAGGLVIAVHRGFEQPFLDFFSRVQVGHAAVCGAALSRAQRVLVSDVTQSEIFAGQAALDVLLAEEVRAVQSTPLISSTGKLLGMISTHFGQTTSLTGRELRFMDLLARQAADYLERKQTQRALEAKQAQLERIAGSVAVLVNQCSRDLRYVFVNRAYADFIGTPAELLVGKPISEVLGEGTLRRIRPYIDRVLAGERVEYETVVQAGSKGARHVRAVYVPDTDAAGIVVGWIETIEDVTEERVAQQKLRNADRQKDEFVAMLSHELRNPLQPILSAADVLSTENASKPDVSWAAGIITRQASHMARMLEDLLDASRIVQKRLTLRKERLDIVKVVQSAAEAVRSLVKARGHQLALTLPGDPLYVYADATRLEQAIVNLLNNAAQFTEPHGHIQVSCRRDDSAVLLSVKDDGIGIAPELRARLFDLFAREHDAGEKHSDDGLGIGLWLTREIVQLHGGRIEVVSEGVGKGSEFRIQLPATRAHPVHTGVAPDTRGVSSSESASRKHSVLVVDDLVEVTSALARLLRGMGHEVHVAHDGRAGIDAAAKLRPDVIILDIGMPGLDGYDVCREIRQQPGGKDILIAALTGWGRESDVRRAAEAGFDRHLTKPLESSKLCNLLASVESRARSH